MRVVDAQQHKNSERYSMDIARLDGTPKCFHVEAVSRSFKSVHNVTAVSETCAPASRARDRGSSSLSISCKNQK